MDWSCRLWSTASRWCCGAKTFPMWSCWWSWNWCGSEAGQSISKTKRTRCANLKWEWDSTRAIGTSFDQAWTLACHKNNYFFIQLLNVSNERIKTFTKQLQSSKWWELFFIRAWRKLFVYILKKFRINHSPLVVAKNNQKYLWLFSPMQHSSHGLVGWKDF